MITSTHRAKGETHVITVALCSLLVVRKDASLSGPLGARGLQGFRRDAGSNAEGRSAHAVFNWKLTDNGSEGRPCGLGG